MTDQTAAGLAEPSTVAYLVTGLARGEPSICFEDERGDYGDEDHMPIFEALVRKSDYAALLAQFEEQRAVSARMEADARRYRWIKADEGDGFRLIQIQFASHHYDEKIDAAIASQQAGGKAA